MKVLVIDIGGSSIKLRMTGQKERIKLESSPQLTPQDMMNHVRKVIKGWKFDVVSIGIPAPVSNSGRILHEPTHLGTGWIRFNFEKAFQHPVKLANDAVIQAVGGYRGGRMLFLGLGTGLGAALVDSGRAIALELCVLRYSRKRSIEEVLCKKELKTVGKTKWEATVHEVARMLHAAFIPNEILIGGGNAKHLSHLPPHCRQGGNDDAFLGGERLWTEPSGWIPAKHNPAGPRPHDGRRRGNKAPQNAGRETVRRTSGSAAGRSSG